MSYPTTPHYPIVILKTYSPNKEPSQFETYLGPALQRLGTIPQTIRLSCTCTKSHALRNDCLPCCNFCSEFITEEKLEVFGVSWPLPVIKREAEKCKLLVPFVEVPGLVPDTYDRHWIFRGAWGAISSLICGRRGADRVQRGVDTAKLAYKTYLDEEFNILDEFTDTLFTSAQMQMLASRHLNSHYQRFRDENSDRKLGKYPWSDIRCCKEVFMLHDRREADMLKENWGIFTPPLTEIRNYLGEKIAFSLAWRMCWVRWGLMAPAVTGLISLLYGVIRLGAPAPTEDVIVVTRSGITEPDLTPDPIPDLTPDGPVTGQSASVILQLLLDNTLVPYHALFMCLWTTFYLVKWFSQTSTLQFEWGMFGYTLQGERERSTYTGTPLDDTFENSDLKEGTKDKCINLCRKILSLAASIGLLLAVILAFFLSLYVKFMLRETLVDEHGEKQYWVFDASFIANLASSTTNAICISVLSKIFVRVAYRLTVFENHIFETDFEKSLTWKLFILEFINTHFNNMLVLFFRDIFEKGGIFGIDPEKCDLCANDDCLTSIAMNVIMILVIQDLVMPLLLWLYYLIRRYDNNRIQQLGLAQHGQKVEAHNSATANVLTEIAEEVALPSETIPGASDPQQDYSTLLVMLKKIQLYSVVVMYTAACPIAPALLFCLELGSHYRDRNRYTGGSRRVAAQRADGIKYWSSIQELVNTVGIITNSIIISRVSSQGRKLFGVHWANYYSVASSTQCDPCNELAQVKEIGLWILCVALVAILVITTHFIAAYFNSTSVHLKIAMRKEQYEIGKKLNLSGKAADTPRVGANDRPARVRSPLSDESYSLSNKSVNLPQKTFGYAVHKTEETTKL